jgi:hypothetical protein
MKNQVISEDITKKNINRKRIKIIFIFSLSAIILFLFLFLPSKGSCGDGTLNGNCSENKPYFCENEILVENPSVCGCPEILTLSQNKCIFKHFTGRKKVTLDYILRGDKGEIDLTVYEGVRDYLSSLYKSSSGISRKDLKLDIVNEEKQRDLLIPLVVKIQNITKNKEDQMRIAVSLVQNIPYGSSKDNITIGYYELSYRRFPYEVIYDNEGVCDEKSVLLIFLLKELGYDVSLFYYPNENHEAVGIKCPTEYSLGNTSYCFVEASGPSIISNSEQFYFGGSKLSSDFELIHLFNGTSLNKDLYEFSDAKNWMNLNKILEEKGELNFFRYYKLKNIKEKYGLLF